MCPAYRHSARTLRCCSALAIRGTMPCPRDSLDTPEALTQTRKGAPGMRREDGQSEGRRAGPLGFNLTGWPSRQAATTS